LEAYKIAIKERDIYYRSKEVPRNNNFNTSGGFNRQNFGYNRNRGYNNNFTRDNGGYRQQGGNNRNLRWNREENRNRVYDDQSTSNSSGYNKKAIMPKQEVAEYSSTGPR